MKVDDHVIWWPKGKHKEPLVEGQVLADALAKRVKVRVTAVLSPQVTVKVGQDIAVPAKDLRPLDMSVREAKARDLKEKEAKAERMRIAKAMREKAAKREAEAKDAKDPKEAKHLKELAKDAIKRAEKLEKE